MVVLAFSWRAQHICNHWNFAATMEIGSVNVSAAAIEARRKRNVKLPTAHLSIGLTGKQKFSRLKCNNYTLGSRMYRINNEQRQAVSIPFVDFDWKKLEKRTKLCNPTTLFERERHVYVLFAHGWRQRTRVHTDNTLCLPPTEVRATTSGRSSICRRTDGTYILEVQHHATRVVAMLWQAMRTSQKDERGELTRTVIT